MIKTQDIWIMLGSAIHAFHICVVFSIWSIIYEMCFYEFLSCDICLNCHFTTLINILLNQIKFVHTELSLRHFIVAAFDVNKISILKFWMINKREKPEEK